jgi:hypothetical protein
MEKYNVCVREEDLFVCAGSVRQSGASSEGAEHIQRKRGEQRHTHIQTTATDRCTYKKEREKRAERKWRTQEQS